MSSDKKETGKVQVISKNQKKKLKRKNNKAKITEPEQNIAKKEELAKEMDKPVIINKEEKKESQVEKEIVKVEISNSPEQITPPVVDQIKTPESIITVPKKMENIEPAIVEVKLQPLISNRHGAMVKMTYSKVSYRRESGVKTNFTYDFINTKKYVPTLLLRWKGKKIGNFSTVREFNVAYLDYVESLQDEYLYELFGTQDDLEPIYQLNRVTKQAQIGLNPWAMFESQVSSDLETLQRTGIIAFIRGLRSDDVIVDGGRDPRVKMFDFLMHPAEAAFQKRNQDLLLRYFTLPGPDPVETLRNFAKNFESPFRYLARLPFDFDKTFKRVIYDNRKDTIYAQMLLADANTPLRKVATQAIRSLVGNYYSMPVRQSTASLLRMLEQFSTQIGRFSEPSKLPGALSASAAMSFGRDIITCALGGSMSYIRIEFKPSVFSSIELMSALALKLFVPSYVLDRRTRILATNVIVNNLVKYYLSPGGLGGGFNGLVNYRCTDEMMDRGDIDLYEKARADGAINDAIDAKIGYFVANRLDGVGWFNGNLFGYSKVSSIREAETFVNRGAEDVRAPFYAGEAMVKDRVMSNFTNPHLDAFADFADAVSLSKANVPTMSKGAPDMIRFALTYLKGLNARMGILAFIFDQYTDAMGMCSAVIPIPPRSAFDWEEKKGTFREAFDHAPADVFSFVELSDPESALEIEPDMGYVWSGNQISRYFSTFAHYWNFIITNYPLELYSKRKLLEMTLARTPDPSGIRPIMEQVMELGTTFLDTWRIPRYSDPYLTALWDSTVKFVKDISKYTGYRESFIYDPMPERKQILDVFSQVMVPREIEPSEVVDEKRLFALTLGNLLGDFFRDKMINSKTVLFNIPIKISSKIFDSYEEIDFDQDSPIQFNDVTQQTKFDSIETFAVPKDVMFGRGDASLALSQRTNWFPSEIAGSIWDFTVSTPIDILNGFHFKAAVFKDRVTDYSFSDLIFIRKS